MLQRNAESTGFVVALGDLSIRECLRRCIDEKSGVSCRFVEFARSTGECFVGIDGGPNRHQMLSTVPLNDIDLYELVCLDPSVDLPCQGEFVFEHIPNASLNAEDSGFMAKARGLFLFIFFIYIPFYDHPLDLGTETD